MALASMMALALMILCAKKEILTCMYAYTFIIDWYTKHAYNNIFLAMNMSEELGGLGYALLWAMLRI